MAKLLQFEDGTPMRFFILSRSTLPTTIETLGGELSSPFHADFVLFDDEKAVTKEIEHLQAPLINRLWVEQSGTAGRIQPIYAHLRDASRVSRLGGLTQLRGSGRDLAELVKAVMDLNGAAPDREMYELMHRKYPHQTSQQWQSLYEGNTTKIDTTIAAVKADLEKKLDDCITFLLCGQTEGGEEGTLMMDEADTLFTREDDIDIEKDGTAPRGDTISTKTDGDATDDHESTSLSGSSADGEADVDDDFPSPSVVTKSKQGYGRGRGNIQGNKVIRYTEAELDAMAAFLAEQGLMHRIASLSHWKLFCQRDPARNNRTPEAWSAQYGRHRGDLNSRALLLSNNTQAQQPEGQEQAVPVSGNNDMNTTQHHHDEAERLPSGWETCRSVKYVGTPFYHHAASKTSFWKLSDVLKFSKSRGETMTPDGVSSEKRPPGSS